MINICRAFEPGNIFISTETIKPQEYLKSHANIKQVSKVLIKYFNMRLNESRLGQTMDFVVMRFRISS
jgi:hypothetical protein